MNRPVLVVLEGGVADIRYVPAGVTVAIKDFDIEGVDTDDNDLVLNEGQPYLLSVIEGPHTDGVEAKAEAHRLAKVTP
jgi:hypothetical protein